VALRSVRVVALAVAVVLMGGCGATPTRTVASACSVLDDLTLRQVSLPSPADAHELIAEFARLEHVIPEEHAADVRALRDGIARVMELADEHGQVRDLSGLPDDARWEATERLQALTWPARRLEEFRRTECR
jgi:hypothetical protein